MRVLIAIPVFNEARFLPEVLRQTRLYTREILIIDDGSTDETATLLQQEPDVHQLRHSANRGYGQSLIDAFQWADRRGYDWIITMDCDGQHEPSWIPDFIAAAQDDADIISGSRYLRAFDHNSPPPLERLAINQQITSLLNEVLQLKITDAFCGFKAHRMSAMRRLRLTVPGYAMPLQMWVQARRYGLRICERPVPLIYHESLERTFGGALDDADTRLMYYYEVLAHELGEQMMGLIDQQRSRNPFSDPSATRCPEGRGVDRRLCEM